MAIRNLILFLIFCLQIGQTELFAGVTEEKHEPWMDSVIAEGVRKIGEAEAWQANNPGIPQRDWITGETYGTHYIVIDAANWAPILVNEVFYYERSATGSYVSTAGLAISDSVDDYNRSFRNRIDYISYYNIVINNFPFPLEKDISKVNGNESQTMFAQLQALKAVDNQKYGDAAGKFYTIIQNITTQAQNLFPTWSIVCYGCANMLGQYAQENQYRASYCAEMVTSIGVDTSLSWVKQMYQLPRIFHSNVGTITPPTIREKNTQVSMAIRNFIMCNQYGVCRADANVFTNTYARWLYSLLYGAMNIDQQKLMNTCMSLNQLSSEMAWSVVTADYENTYTMYNTQGIVNVTYRNSTLDTINGLVKSIQRGADQLKTNSSIGRDSALYYGRLLYRIPSYMQSITVEQRIRLLDVITNAVCGDIMGATDASDYTNHCERICKALYTYLPAGDEKSFLDGLKTNGLLWDISYRLEDPAFGFFGESNYTDYIFTLSYYWKIAYPEKSKPPLSNSLNYVAIKWQSDFFSSNGAVVVEKATNEIKLLQKLRAGADEETTSWWQENDEPYEMDVFHMDVYDPVTIHVAQGSLIPGLPGVRNLTVPALFLDWLYYKKNLDDVATFTHTALIAAGLVTGIGEFYGAATLTMRAIYGVQVLVTAADLVVLNQTARDAIIAQFNTPQEGEEFIELYQEISLAINATVIAKSLITAFDYECAQFVSKFDNAESGLINSLGNESDEYKALKTLRENIGTVKAANAWLDNLESVLGPGSKWKIQSWIDGGLDATKTEAAFAATTDKVTLYNTMNDAKSVYEQRIYIQDWDNIPGVIKTQWTPNGLTTGTRTNAAWNNSDLDLPADEAANFVDVTAVEFPPGTKLYRVTGGNKAGAYWTLDRPNSLADVIGGTAVQPKWNSFETLYVYEVPANSTLKAWKGTTASQPLSPTVANPHLPGGVQQVYIPQVLRDENFSILVNPTARPW